jgi:hypothetical protein
MVGVNFARSTLFTGFAANPATTQEAIQDLLCSDAVRVLVPVGTVLKRLVSGGAPLGVLPVELSLFSAIGNEVFWVVLSPSFMV